MFHICNTYYENGCLDKESYVLERVAEYQTWGDGCLEENLGAVEMFWVYTGNALGGIESLELRLTRRWNEPVSHYDMRSWRPIRS